MKGVQFFQGKVKSISGSKCQLYYYPRKDFLSGGKTLSSSYCVQLYRAIQTCNIKQFSAHKQTLNPVVRD